MVLPRFDSGGATTNNKRESHIMRIQSKSRTARDAHTATVAAASERRRRFQLFAAHGVPIGRNPYTPPRSV
jgi:hypothetical protein